MASRRLLFSAALLFLFISAEVSTILAQNNGNNNGNNNSGNNNGSNNNGNNNGNNNNGNDNGNNNNGDNNGNGNTGSNNGNGNTGSNNGNGNNNSGQGNGNTGDGHGNGNNGNGNDSGTSGNGNGNTGSNNGNGNSGNNNGNGNNGNGNGNGNGNKTNPYPHDAASTNYTPVSRRPGTNEERFFCLARGRCHYNTLTCPSECPERKPRNNKRQKGCFVDCSSKCEVTCKWRRPRCNGYGALCYDPRFVGGDGVMFYFHGGKGSDFAIVSDEKFQINAHFIGSRPQGRTRDFTWVQALSVMFDTHTLVLAAKKVSHWENDVDALIVKWDGESVVVPMDGDAEWRVNTGEREAVVERTDDVNTVRVTVSGLLEMDMRVVPIGEEENRVHNYQLPTNDAFAHLETQFKFFGLTDLVEGVLGKTYRPGYVSPVKRGVPMPMMGGEDKYLTASLYSTACKVCRFERPLALAAAE